MKKLHWIDSEFDRTYFLLNWEWNKVSVPKIISKSCELVKLRHINRSGTVFFEKQCTSGLEKQTPAIL